MRKIFSTFLPLLFIPTLFYSQTSPDCSAVTIISATNNGTNTVATYFESNGIRNSWKGITAAHIKPRAHGGEYSTSNIIPLIEPIHQLFDRGIFTITNDYKIEIHKQALHCVSGSSVSPARGGVCI